MVASLSVTWLAWNMAFLRGETKKAIEEQEESTKELIKLAEQCISGLKEE
jgi:hypothetical protein